MSGRSPFIPTLPAGPRRLEVLFFGNKEGQGHRSYLYGLILQAALSQEGINFTYVTSPEYLNADSLARYDALMFYGDYFTLPPDQEKALVDFVEGGKGFLPIHTASNSFNKSAAYVKLVGGKFKTHGSTEFAAEVVKPDHPIMEGFTPFSTNDETYVHSDLSDDRTVLMERVDAKGREPWTWVRTQGKGRVFYTASGHTEQTWRRPEFQHLLRNAIFWAVGPEALQRLKDYAIAPFQYRSDTGPVPRVGILDPSNPTPRYQEPLAPAEAIKHLQVPPGFTVTAFVTEPMVVNPMAMAWDERGRLWVVESHDYPFNKQPLWQGNDVIKIFEDTNHDGKADKMTVFAEHLSVAEGITFANGGVIVAQAPEFLFLKDTNGDDKADIKQVIMTGWGYGDTHGEAGNLGYGFDNWLWGSVGYNGFNGTISGTNVNFNAGVYRFTADGSKLESQGRFSNNTFGLGFTEAFDVFGSTANNTHSVYVGMPRVPTVDRSRDHGSKKIDGHYAVRPNTAKIRQIDSYGGYTASAGHHFYTARDFPQEYWNKIAFVNEPTAHVVHRALISRDGAGFKESDGNNILASDDEWFAPIQAEVGPDGALWVIDRYQFVISYTRTNLLQNSHGRIYRVTWNGATPKSPMALHPDQPTELVAALRNDNQFWRLTAQRLLVERGKLDVADALYAIAADRSVDAVGNNAPVIHALWTLHGLKAFTGTDARAMAALRQALQHPSAGVRRNAVMMLPTTNPEAFVEELTRAGILRDPDANVRLAALTVIAGLPSSVKLGRMLYETSKDTLFLADEWLSEAVSVAAGRHNEGFLAAYAEEIGMATFLRQATSAARGELENFPGYATVTNDGTPWKTVANPVNIWGQHQFESVKGGVWLRKTIELPPRFWGSTPGILRVGSLGESDVAYINGTRIGMTANGGGYRTREYTVPTRVLPSYGSRSLVVAFRVTPGLYRRPSSAQDSIPITLVLDTLTVPMTGPWEYRLEATWPDGRSHELSLARRVLEENNPVADMLKPLLPSGVVEPPRPAARVPAAKPTAATGAAAPSAAAAVTSVKISVVPGQVAKYDQTLVTAKAGQPVEIAFTNTSADAPHNLVVFEKMPRTQIEKMLAGLLTDPKFTGGGFMPPKLVLQATPLLTPTQSATLSFKAPTVPGDYVYLCTFPGHAATMNGTLRVVAP